MSRPRSTPTMASLVAHLATIATAERELSRAVAGRRIAFADLQAATDRFQASQAPDDEETMLTALAEHRQAVDDCRIAEADLDSTARSHNRIL